MPKEVLFRVGQAAKDLGVSSYKIRRLCETGLINAEFSGSQWEIPAGEVPRLKRDGIPSAPKIVDTDDAEASNAPNRKERSAPTLLADPSLDMIAAAEEAEMSGRQLATARNKLEQSKLAREQAEIEDYFDARQKRLQEQEAEELKRYEEELEANVRRRHKEAAVAQRKKFFSEWLEYALRKKPWSAPAEVELDIHCEVLVALARVDINEREYVVRRLVDAATERALGTWRAGQAKREAAEDAIQSMPWLMTHDQAWKAQTAKIAREALKDVSACACKEEMASEARAALQPLIQQFEHAGRIQEAVNAVHVDGADYDELRDARESVREALEGLANNSTGRQITAARKQALLPVSTRVAERIAREEAERQREEAQRRRKQVLSSVSWRLPFRISDDDRESAIEEINEALDGLPADASQRDMEKARDAVIEGYEAADKEKARRAERKAEQGRKKADLVQYGIGQIRPTAERLLRQFDYDVGQTAWSIEARVKSEVHKALEEELNGTETEQEVTRIVRSIMRAAEGCE
jgi:hypothetical protein